MLIKKANVFDTSPKIFSRDETKWKWITMYSIWEAILLNRLNSNVDCLLTCIYVNLVPLNVNNYFDWFIKIKQIFEILVDFIIGIS